MGLTPFPAALVERLARTAGATAFVETGTFNGATTAWAAAHFPIVHTIELGAMQHGLAAARLSMFSNVTCHLGDSRRVLPELVARLRGHRAVYYLDGHWSGDGTSGEADQCPLLDELACLSADDVIVIDDARLFCHPVPPPLDPAQWPTLAQVRAALPASHLVEVRGDVIVSAPIEVWDDDVEM